MFTATSLLSWSFIKMLEVKTQKTFLSSKGREGYNPRYHPN